MPRQLTLVLPSIATISSLIFGVVAIMVLADGNFVLATTLIILGSILDVLDGQLAVRLNAVSDIGKELDSLADVITFGVAPTILIYHLLLVVGVGQLVAIASSIAFVIAGALRLARFNTLPSNRDAYFQGMPIPMASGIILTAAFWHYWMINLWWAVAVIIVSYLMVSPFPYPKSKHFFTLSSVSWAIIVMMAVGSWLLLGWQAVPFALFLLYAITGPLLALQQNVTKYKEGAL